MPSGDRMLAMTLTAFVLIAVPGPSVLFVVSRSVMLGRRAGLTTVVGNTAGVFVLAVLVAIGIGSIVERSAAVFHTVKLLGAAYLVVLGVRALRGRRKLTEGVGRPLAPRSLTRIMREGFTVGLTNPKAIVIFTAVLPQFANREAGHVPLQLMVFALVFCAIALVSDSAWAVAAGTARNWFARSPRRLEAVGGAGGVVLIGLGMRLAVTGRRD